MVLLFTIIAAIIVASFAFKHYFSKSPKDKMKDKLVQAQDKSKELEVKDKYLDLATANKKKDTQLSKKEKKIES